MPSSISHLRTAATACAQRAPANPARATDALPFPVVIPLLPATGDAADSRLFDDALSFFPATLRRRSRIVACRTGQIAFDGGQAQRTAYRLLQGDIAVRRQIMGRQVDLQRAAAGDWLIAPDRRALPPDVLAVCESASMLLAVPTKALADALEREPDFSRAWQREIEAQIARLQRRVARLHLHQRADRVAHYLATESPGGCGKLTLPFTKRAWAAHLGMAPETLSRTLTEMVAGGVVEQLRRDTYRLRAWPRPGAYPATAEKN